MDMKNKIFSGTDSTRMLIRSAKRSLTPVIVEKMSVETSLNQNSQNAKEDKTKDNNQIAQNTADAKEDKTKDNNQNMENPQKTDTKADKTKENSKENTQNQQAADAKIEKAKDNLNAKKSNDVKTNTIATEIKPKNIPTILTLTTLDPPAPEEHKSKSWIRIFDKVSILTLLVLFLKKISCKFFCVIFYLSAIYLKQQTDA